MVGRATVDGKSPRSPMVDKLAREVQKIEAKLKAKGIPLPALVHGRSTSPSKSSKAGSPPRLDPRQQPSKAATGQAGNLSQGVVNGRPTSPTRVSQNPFLQQQQQQHLQGLPQGRRSPGSPPGQGQTGQNGQRSTSPPAVDRLTNPWMPPGTADSHGGMAVVPGRTGSPGGTAAPGSRGRAGSPGNTALPVSRGSGTAVPGSRGTDQGSSMNRQATRGSDGSKTGSRGSLHQMESLGNTSVTREKATPSSVTSTVAPLVSLTPEEELALHLTLPVPQLRLNMHGRLPNGQKPRPPPTPPPRTPELPLNAPQRLDRLLQAHDPAFLPDLWGQEQQQQQQQSQGQPHQEQQHNHSHHHYDKHHKHHSHHHHSHSNHQSNHQHHHAHGTTHHHHHSQGSHLHPSHGHDHQHNHHNEHPQQHPQQQQQQQQHDHHHPSNQDHHHPTQHQHEHGLLLGAGIAATLAAGLDRPHSPSSTTLHTARKALTSSEQRLNNAVAGVVLGTIPLRAARPEAQAKFKGHSDFLNTMFPSDPMTADERRVFLLNQAAAAARLSTAASSAAGLRGAAAPGATGPLARFASMSGSGSLFSFMQQGGGHTSLLRAESSLGSQIMGGTLSRATSEAGALAPGGGSLFGAGESVTLYPGGGSVSLMAGGVSGVPKQVTISEEQMIALPPLPGGGTSTVQFSGTTFAALAGGGPSTVSNSGAVGETGATATTTTTGLATAASLGLRGSLSLSPRASQMQAAAQPQVSEIWGVLDDSEEGVRMSRGVTNKVFMPNQLAIGTALVGGGGPPGVPGGGGGGAGGAAGGRGALAGFVFDFGANTRKVSNTDPIWPTLQLTIPTAQSRGGGLFGSGQQLGAASGGGGGGGGSPGAGRRVVDVRPQLEGVMEQVLAEASFGQGPSNMLTAELSGMRA